MNYKYKNIELFKKLESVNNVLTYQTLFDDELKSIKFINEHCMLDYLQRIIIADLIHKIDFGGK